MGFSLSVMCLRRKSDGLLKAINTNDKFLQRAALFNPRHTDGNMMSKMLQIDGENLLYTCEEYHLNIADTKNK